MGMRLYTVASSMSSTLYSRKLLREKTFALLFRKANGFYGPFSIWIVQNSLGNANIHLPLVQGCLPPLINLTTTIALVRTVLTSDQPFTQVYSKGEL